jgi:hypothetical protein
MFCPTCGKDAGNNPICGACGNPVALGDAAMSAHDEVIWSADDPATDVVPNTAGDARTVGSTAGAGAPKDPTGGSGGMPRPPKDPTSPSASRPRPPKEVLLKRRVVIGGALVAVILLVVILAVTLGGGSNKSATADSTPSTEVADSTPAGTASGPGVTDSVPSSATGVTGVSGLNSLAKGSTGPLVAVVQQALLSRGYQVTVSGTFDDATVLAVKKFQKNVNLPVVGKVGPSTRAALGLGELRDSEITTYKQAVTAVVTYLNKGKYGLLPKDALKSLYAFRQITKGKRIVWSVDNLEVAKLVAEPAAGQAVASLKLLNESTKSEHTLTVCFTKTAPIQWCGLWVYS